MEILYFRNRQYKTIFDELVIRYLDYNNYFNKRLFISCYLEKLLSDSYHFFWLHTLPYQHYL